ncbi:uncharacterized protein LOC133534706 [Cydia pomonella]|uniref:uncharacterized protein LOC133534706 n=1 Tax=Cydia pomonella TaxID=82600 RepID=UPI002ADD3ED3|nr:uncharacterized protein LOC133534706 [Cydia pomonella]
MDRMEAGQIEELVAEPNIMGESKAHRLRWLGYLEGMDEDRNVKRAYLGRLAEGRPIGRPRYRWSDMVEADLRELRVDNWREVAQDREKWRCLVSDAKSHFGSLSQRSK